MTLINVIVIPAKAGIQAGWETRRFLLRNHALQLATPIWLWRLRRSSQKLERVILLFVSVGQLRFTRLAMLTTTRRWQMSYQNQPLSSGNGSEFAELKLILKLLWHRIFLCYFNHQHQRRCAPCKSVRP